MKGVLTGIKNLKKVQEGSNQRTGSSFLTLKDGQSATVRFVQELDAEGKFHEDDRGLAVSVFEHTNPDDFSQRFLCTNEDEGKCVGCERVPTNPRWKRRARLFINAYVKEDDAVRVVATGFSSKGIGSALIEYAEDFGTICDRFYKLKRNGEGLKTSYTLYPREISQFELDKYTESVVDLGNFTKYRTYDEVEAYLSGSEDDASKKNSSAGW